MYMGPDVLKDVIEDAELYPIRGLFNFSNCFDEIDAYYHRTAGYEFGVSTGWRALNELYNVRYCVSCSMRKKKEKNMSLVQRILLKLDRG